MFKQNKSQPTNRTRLYLARSKRPASTAVSFLLLFSIALTACFSFGAPSPAGEAGGANNEMEAAAEGQLDELGSADESQSIDSGESAMADNVDSESLETEADAPDAPDAPDAVEEEAADSRAMDGAAEAMSETAGDASTVSNQAMLAQVTATPAQVIATPRPRVTASATMQPFATRVVATAQSQSTIATAVNAIELPSAIEPPAMFFDDYGVNPFVNTVDDNLSTFAMDVDTGSYTVMRNYVRQGSLPPQEAVRVEEFVNYFDYDYTMPDQGDVFAIDIDVTQAPFADVVSSDESAALDVRTVRVGIQGYEISAELRDDVALTFVVDVSGSMGRENRLTLAKRALNMLVEELRPTDSVAIVVYGSAARIALQPTMATDGNKNDIIAAIHRLNTEGSTNAEAGLRVGYGSAWRNFNSQANNRVILISDGVANVGATGPDSIWSQIKQYAERGITMTSVGVGMGNYNDVLMEQLADMGDGTYAYVDTIDEARRIFVDELTGTLQTIAKDAKVQVEFNQSVVSAYRLIGYENRDVADEDFRNDSVDAGEIGAGHSVTALYEVVLREDVLHGDVLRGDQDHAETVAPDSDEALLTVSLRWLDPKTDEPTEIAASKSVAEYTTAFDDNAPDFQLAVVVAEYAEVLRASHWTAEDSVSAELVDEIFRIGSELENDEKVSEFVNLVERASRLATRG